MYRIVLPLPPRRELQQRYEQHVVVLDKALHELQRRIKRAVEQQGLHPTLKYRIKSFDSAYEKLLRRARTAHDGDAIEITDLLGIRVVCPFVEDIGTAERIVRDAFEVVEVERKGADLGTTEFGYASIHMLLKMPDDIGDSFHVSSSWLCEVQLRTILQDAWAEVEHELVYKAELTPLDERLRRKLAALNANLTLSDIIFQEIRDYQRAMQSRLMRRRETFWSQVSGIDDVAPRVDLDPALDPEGVDTPDDGDVQLIETGSDTIDSMLIKALHAHNQKDYAGAIRLYTDILAYQPDAAVAAMIHTHRGMARYGLKDFSGAIEDFSAAIERAPREVRAYYYRGVVYRTLEDYHAALRDFSQSLAADPYHLDALVARARVHRLLGDEVAAREDVELAQSIEPDHPAVVEMNNSASGRVTL